MRECSMGEGTGKPLQHGNGQPTGTTEGKVSPGLSADAVLFRFASRVPPEESGLPWPAQGMLAARVKIEASEYVLTSADEPRRSLRVCLPWSLPSSKVRQGESGEHKAQRLGKGKQTSSNCANLCRPIPEPEREERGGFWGGKQGAEREGAVFPRFWCRSSRPSTRSWPARATRRRRRPE